jgi:hypothetical protein
MGHRHARYRNCLRQLLSRAVFSSSVAFLKTRAIHKNLRFLELPFSKNTINFIFPVFFSEDMSFCL